jgi:hypothetical protein
VASIFHAGSRAGRLNSGVRPFLEINVSEALIGVLIGGVLSALGTWVALFLQQSKWHSELQISHLKEKRERLEAACQRILESLPKAMAENSYSIALLSEIDFLLPKSVSDAFEAMMRDKDRDETKNKEHLYTIARCMRKEVGLIDAEIARIATGGKA